MRLTLAISAAFALLACEPSTNNINIATQTRLYGSARVLNLLSPAQTSTDAGFTGVSTFVSVQGDLPTAFTAFPPPGVSTFQPTGAGTWTAWLSLAESPLASSAAQPATQGQRFTVVETPNAAGFNGSATLQWNLEAAPTIPSGQVAVRFVNGATQAPAATATLGGTALQTSSTLGAVSAWQFFAPSATTLTVTSGTASSFTIPALTAGQLHTYALSANAAGALILIDILEAPGGDGTASAPISPS